MPKIAYATVEPSGFADGAVFKVVEDPAAGGEDAEVIRHGAGMAPGTLVRIASTLRR